MPHRTWLFRILLIGIFLLAGVISAQAGADNHRTPDGKLKVLYHIDSSNVGTAKYAMALINKHIEAEGGLEKIDIKVVVHGPALMLFDKETVDPARKAKLKKILDIGVKPEMCQVSMKLFNRPLDKLTPGFQPAGHPVAVKRIADLQEQGHLYIKP